MKKYLVAAIVAAFAGLMTPSHAETNRHKYLVAHDKCERKLGKRPCGRNAVHDGLRRKDGSVRDVRLSDYKRLLPQLRKLNAPVRRYLSRVGVRPAQAPAGAMTASARATGAPLASIRACESGSSGGYSAVSPGGTYRGAYQFDQQTWNSVGGSGDPASASPAEQDKRAAMLYAQRGASAWPVCGR